MEKESIKDRVTKYQKLFGLDNWIFDVGFDFQLTANARTLADPRYNKATITFKNEEQGDEVIVHELIHVTMALYDFYADNLGKEGSDELFFVAREASVSQLTHIMMRILQ